MTSSKLNKAMSVSGHSVFYFPADRLRNKCLAKWYICGINLRYDPS
jgi:hypothetical protein